jgi:hypothetical protein
MLAMMMKRKKVCSQLSQSLRHQGYLLLQSPLRLKSRLLCSEVMMTMKKKTPVKASSLKHLLPLLSLFLAWVLVLKSNLLIFSEVMTTMKRKILVLKCPLRLHLSSHLLLLPHLRLQ